MRLHEALRLANHLEEVHGNAVWGVVNGAALLQERKIGLPPWTVPARSWLILTFEDTGKGLVGTSGDSDLFHACLPLVNVNDTFVVCGDPYHPKMIGTGQEITPCDCAVIL